MNVRRIMIVSDDDVAARELSATLTALGYDVAAIASPGNDAVALADQLATDLVLLHASAGNPDSMATADSMRRNRSRSVVFAGPESGEVVLRHSAPAEPQDYIALPCSARELRLGIDLAVCRHDATRAVDDLEGFFAASIDMFCFLDFNGYFRRLNPAWETTLGYTRGELMSRRFIEFVHPDDRERTLRQNAEVRGGGQATSFENRYVRKDGSYRWFLWNASPHPDRGVIYAVARDITRRKQAEAERARLRRELDASQAEVRTLQDIVPICLYCKRVRDDANYWRTVESYIVRHTGTRLSHGICPSCMANVVEPDLREFEEE